VIERVARTEQLSECAAAGDRLERYRSNKFLGAARESTAAPACVSSRASQTVL
jgi:hypothetical protein